VCLSSLPCLAIFLSSAQAKLHFKNGSPKPSLIPSGGSNKIMELLFESVTILISIIGQSIKEENLTFLPELLSLKKAYNTETVRSLNMGTPKRLIVINSSTFLSWFTNRRVVILLTFYVTKPLWSVIKILVGGKIAEKANVLGNAKNTGYSRSESIKRNRGLKSGLSPLNSVSLNKISSIIPIGRAYSTQNLTSSGFCVSRSDAHSISTPNIISPPNPKKLVAIDDDNPLNIREQVELKQKELVKLAERHGIFDPRVLQAQLLMARSLLFRTHAVNLMAKKAGSQTAGVDNEIIDNIKLGFSKVELIL